MYEPRFRIISAQCTFLLFKISNNIPMRKKLLKIYVYLGHTIGCETWIISIMEMKRMEAFGVWYFINLDKILNNKVFQRRRSLLQSIKKIRASLIQRKDLLKIILEDMVERVNPKGRPPLNFIIGFGQIFEMVLPPQY